MAKNIYAVTGATGHIGKVVIEKLKAVGHEVRAVSRKAGVPIEDAAALARAFKGAAGVFLMVPPDLTAADPRKRQNEVGAALCAAVKSSGVERSVFLSSIGAQLKDGTGPIAGLQDVEERLASLGLAELAILRPAYFMENHLQGIGLIRQSGIYGSALKADVAFPMIATADIGAKAAELLQAGALGKRDVAELHGPRDYTMTQAAAILGASVGKPGLKYVQFPYEDARKAMAGMGLSAGMADSYIEMSRAFNEGLVRATQPRSAATTTPTTLEAFAEKVFRPTFQGAAAGVR
jgi:uncharacterized protein YbjT (DUF2867 family)